jgi:hypothetical protein
MTFRTTMYIKITRAVEDEVLGVLSNAKVLLRYALLSITESIRNDPERYRLIFYNMSPSITNYSSSNSQPQQPQYLSPDNNTEANAAIIDNFTAFKQALQCNNIYTVVSFTIAYELIVIQSIYGKIRMRYIAHGSAFLFILTWYKLELKDFMMKSKAIVSFLVGMNPQDVVNLLRIANNHLPSV